MAASIVNRNGGAGRLKCAESGFSLIEVVISMAILTVGMVSLLGVFGLAMASTQTSEQDMIAKQLANEAYESLVVTARNTSQMNWDQKQCGLGELREQHTAVRDFPGGLHADVQRGCGRNLWDGG